MTVISLMACYKDGWVDGWEGGEVGSGGGWVAKGGLYLPLGHKQQCCVFSK